MTLVDREADFAQRRKNTATHEIGRDAPLRRHAHSPDLLADARGAGDPVADDRAQHLAPMTSVLELMAGGRVSRVGWISAGGARS